MVCRICWRFAGQRRLEGHAKAERDAFGKAAKEAGVSYTQRYAFDTLWNGVSVSINRSDLSKLARLPQVANLWPVDTYYLPEPEEDNVPDMATAIAMTGANVAQGAGVTGAGVRIGIIDTGVDYDHADLGGDGVNRLNSSEFPTGRVKWGYDFVGDAYDANPANPTYNPVPTPDLFPDDRNGHGTHVAGIAAAKGLLTGVAPDAEIGAYRVFGITGSTSADIMIAAMERALADGMQVVNMSIGSAFQWPQYPTATAADRLVNKGVVVVCSIGNSGANGLYSAGAPGVGKKVIGVASFDNTHVVLRTFTISPDNAVIGYGQAAASPAAPTSGTFPMARTGTSTSTADACSPLAAGSLTGRVALIRRGGCSFYVKARNAQLAGAIGVVLYNDSAGHFSPTVAPPTGSPAITIPVVSISGTDGVPIDSRLASGPVSMTWTSTVATLANPTGNLISSFSSYGMAPDLSLKPDIGAPGGLIRSTFPLGLGGYATLSGTSMSSPHVAGTAALYLQARPNTPSQAMRGILQNTADPKVWWGNPGWGFLDNVHRQGAGMVRIDRALAATARIEPGKLSLGESESGPAVRTLTIKNEGASPVTYGLSHVAALSTGANTFTPSFHTSNASAAFSALSVPVPAGGTATVNVTITPATGPNKGIYGGYVVLTPQGGGQVLRVPYAGFIGDYQSIQVLTPTPAGFPWLAQLNPAGTAYLNRSAGATFTMAGNDIPFLLVHFDHQARKWRVEVFDSVTGKAWHRVYDLNYWGRNSIATGFFAFPWDGVTFHGNTKDASKTKFTTVPNGTYVLRLSVLKALGDEANPAHWETWTSPVVTIARP